MGKCEVSLFNFILLNMVDDLIVINVGGKCFEIYEEMFVCFLDIFLGLVS